ncbi:MAG: hypothetical protein A3A97_04615 [Candidatus Terrybacteria bacterium RIFCSPLOWO2_01_FULL_40_23]|uniref:NYN domain-containing protein n=1 Tax=Candidatus Terrybacteria bacterium RIFCSPLOWO2_01_FULL_40_23 TaxID=1802366 RepID=A0A1G2PV13_9BACT|nr:MAG: hypothetical protein A3A97_04615 [Candidatus Terrybacteria bacterium RIFCSPLOWO2_01_FULL_40_23]
MKFIDTIFHLFSKSDLKRRVFFAFVDYGNVNYWYENDERDVDGNILNTRQKLIIDIEKLANFVALFSEQKRFYYGWNPRRKKNWHIAIKAEKCGFIKITKPMQFIKHYLSTGESPKGGFNNSEIKTDANGEYIEIPKSNFDVEISVDAIRLMEKYDTFCLFSGDSDFAYLAAFLKKNKKKFIVVASGQVFHTLKEFADLYINAQQIKVDIVSIKETSPHEGRGLDIGSASGGQGSQ